ncbi:response regulator [Vibrio maerlii]|uniref:response regulator n=1 Tax=Vibrio maerlii TaxID=2231648 RepID=UPI0013E087F7|nr:response regulator [Vibrio maerlii]
MKILIIEDDCVDQEKTRRDLSSLNHLSLSYATSGTSALLLVANESFDCILLDYQLSDYDGLKLMALIKQFGSSSITPIIFLTGQGNEEIAVKAIKSGASDYLVKGHYEPSELLIAIKNGITAAEQDLKKRQLQEEIEKTELINPASGLGTQLLMNNDLRLTVERAKRTNSQFIFATFTLHNKLTLSGTMPNNHLHNIIKMTGETLKQVDVTDSFYQTGQTEFSAIINSVQTREDAQGLIGRLITSINYQLQVRGIECELTVNAGLSQFPYDGFDSIEIMKSAFQLQYNLNSLH